MKIFKKKKFKIVLPLCISLILVALMTAGGVLAYLKSQTNDVVNSFRLGEVEYTLVLEPNAKDANDKYEDEKVSMPTEISMTEHTPLSVMFTPNNNPELTGYTFEGWYYDKDCTKEYDKMSGNSIIVEYGNPNDTNPHANKVGITLYAKWEPIEYAIKYNGNKATSGSMEDLKGIKYDTEVTLAENEYSRTGYTFTGWNMKADGSGTPYADKATVDNLTSTNGETVTLYAQWTPHEYTVKYVNNVDPDDTSVTQPTGRTADSSHIYDVEKKLTTNGFSRTGYTFIGWNTQADGKGTSYSNEESVKNLTAEQGGVVTLYAQWGVKSYVIRYHANGGEGEMADQTVEWDKLTKLSGNKFINNTGDYKFAGWATDSAGEVVYLDEQQIVNLQESGTLDLYAVWLLNSYTVTFDYNIGSGTPPTKEVLYGEEYGVLPPYLTTVTENLFKGWYTAPEGGTRVYPGTIVNLKEDHTLWAHWDPSPANDVIKDLVVHSSADDDNDGVADEMHLEFVCSSSFEKFNIPLKNLVPGQQYTLTYTASNNASFGDYINGYRNARYGSYIVETATETAGNLSMDLPHDIIATWNDRIEPDGTNDGSHEATNDAWLNGPWENRTITFTATASTMYWAWEFGLMQDHVHNDYNIYDISLEPVVPEIKFGSKELIIHESSGAEVLNDSSSAYNSNFVFDGDGYAETMYYPITGLTAGTTYTIQFDHKFTGKLIDDTKSYAETPRYHYGCGIMETAPTKYGSYMNSIGSYLSNTFVMPTVTGNTDEVTLIFKATGTTAYWVWNMANCSDSNNCPIDIKVTEFKAQHADGGSITYYQAD